MFIDLLPTYWVSKYGSFAMLTITCTRSIHLQFSILSILAHKQSLGFTLFQAFQPIKMSLATVSHCRFDESAREQCDKLTNTAQVPTEVQQLLLNFQGVYSKSKTTILLYSNLKISSIIKKKKNKSKFNIKHAIYELTMLHDL